jgi:hypothetical protein
MQGAVEALVSGIVMRGLSPSLATVLMAAPSRKTVRALLKKIYVLDERGDMTGEYVLDADCPIDYSDFLKVLPPEGIGDRDSLFVGEYVFTAFASRKFVFVLLSRGHLAPEDMDWTALILTAADSHLAPATARPPTPRSAESKPEIERAVADREARLAAQEKGLAEQEAKLRAESANLQGRQEELNRQKVQLTALADYTARMQDSVAQGVNRAAKTLERAGEVAADRPAESKGGAESKAVIDARQSFDLERKALLKEKEGLEARHRDATAQIARLEKETKDAIAALEKERATAASKSAEEAKTRHEIEGRVAELTQRFAEVAKERLAASNRPPAESDEVRRATEGEKAELARERKFLQRRAIELLDREERVRDRESKADEREHELARRVDDLTAREQDVARQTTVLAQTKPPIIAGRVEADEAKKDIERRVKIIQQKALELLDREEKLRKRAAELEAMEARLSGRVPAE